jgi:hypothetical protein
VGTSDVVLKGAKSEVLSDVGLIFLPPLFDICGNPLDFFHKNSVRKAGQRKQDDGTG